MDTHLSHSQIYVEKWELMDDMHFHTAAIAIRLSIQQEAISLFYGSLLLTFTVQVGYS